jgi:hypothetical protein
MINPLNYRKLAIAFYAARLLCALGLICGCTSALAAASLGLGDLAFARIEELAKRRSINPSMVDSHNPGPKTLCDDGNGAVPEIVARMLVRSEFDKIIFLPALPKTLPNGNVKGLRVRGGFEVDIAWKDGKLTEAMIRSVNGTKTTVRYLDITTEVSLRPGEKRSLTF